MEYIRAIDKAFDDVERMVRTQFIPGLATRFDASPKQKAAALAKSLRIKQKTARKAAQAAAKKLDRAHKRQHVSTVARTTGVQLQLPEKWKPKILRQWARENAALMERASKRFQEKLAKAVSEGIARGQPISEIQKRIAEQYVRGPEVAKTRRQLRSIVRDQASKLQSRLTKERHDDLGITRYVWRTSQDERVRSTHTQRHGRKFKSASPIEPQLRKAGIGVDSHDGHPGEPPNCRCWREAVLEDLLK